MKQTSKLNLSRCCYPFSDGDVELKKIQFGSKIIINLEVIFNLNGPFRHCACIDDVEYTKNYNNLAETLQLKRVY